MRYLTLNMAVSSGLALIIAGCSSMTQGDTLQKIATDKESSRKKKIEVFDETPIMTGYITKNNKIKQICVANNTSKCVETKKGSSSDEPFSIGERGYNHYLSTKKDVQCGVGSMAGWLIIFSPMYEPIRFKNHSALSPLCGNRFSELDSTQIPMRLIIGALTFMTPFATSGTMHTEKFDNEEFKEAIYLSNIDTFKDELKKTADTYNISGVFDFVYVEQGDMEDSLNDQYKQLLKDSNKKAGVVFVEKKSNRLLSIVVLDKDKDKNIMEKVSSQIQGIIGTIHNNDKFTLRYDDIIPYIPNEVATPLLPALPILIKDEFEKKSEFELRIKKAVDEREANIRDIQRKYSLEVYQRNSYIESLQQAFESYISSTIISKDELQKEIKDNIPSLAKILFLENISGYSGNNFRYDAETEQLYFNIKSEAVNFEQEVVAEIPPSIAKGIKEEALFKIIPDIDFKNNNIIMKGFHILSIATDKSYETKYTNINFKPDNIKVSVTTLDEKIRKEISAKFQEFKQKESLVTSAQTKEIWYLDVAKQINAKVPEWFSAPEQTNSIIGYGEGLSLAEAKASARNDLAYMVKVNVNSVFENTQKVSNFSSFKEIKQKTQQSTNVDLGDNNYRVVKQGNVDGRWYISLEYTKQI